MNPEQEIGFLILILVVCGWFLISALSKNNGAGNRTAAGPFPPGGSPGGPGGMNPGALPPNVRGAGNPAGYSMPNMQPGGGVQFVFIPFNPSAGGGATPFFFPPVTPPVIGVTGGATNPSPVLTTGGYYPSPPAMIPMGVTPSAAPAAGLLPYQNGNGNGRAWSC